MLLLDLLSLLFTFDRSCRKQRYNKKKRKVGAAENGGVGGVGGLLPVAWQHLSRETCVHLDVRVSCASASLQANARTSGVHFFV